jgi:hypothetical protein
MLLEFSKNRLNDEPVPDDVAILLKNYSEMISRIPIRLHWEENWAPSLDVGYPTSNENVDPDVAANIKAIREVCKHISFVAEDEERQYYGYWRGLKNNLIKDSPIVLLGNEGTFRLYGPTFSQAILTTSAFSEDQNDLKAWMINLGIRFSVNFSLLNLKDPPNKLQKDLYYLYRSQ